ncbi:probable serine/threonine-protein kinase DDB_G0268876 isoform X2 [Portunus trituberculatus]|uniref:probable serine/threonine-protein kinase DDB_G0268876 isoform X2 n=1 Tax=Portunus trituberculatus TaxID=210409 RepID=UPI001E1CD91D|nr:probable serine/threonine-protein kinase DDB_G0268876 isoform X2 [Portunus trituberculatus]
MGLWGRRGGKPRLRDKVRASRSSSYSDDYRITPELTPTDTYKHGERVEAECCWQNGGCCHEQGPCCSQDERCCLPGNTHRSPRRGRSTSTGSRRSSFGGVEVVMVNDRHVDLRRTPSCTSCESCDTCRWTSSTITRIPLKNHLFTSPLLSHHDQSPSPPRGLAGRRYNKKETNGTRFEAAPNEKGSRQAGASPSRRQTARNTTTSHPSVQRSNSNTTAANAAGRDTEQKRLSRRDLQRFPQQRKQSGPRRVEAKTSRLSTLSDPDLDPDHTVEERGVPATGDEDGENYENKDAGGGGGGGGGSGGGVSDNKIKVGGGGRKRNSPTTSAAAHASPASKAAVSLTLSKRDLLNQMVNQTKQHRQQIRCLETELERLRSGDALSRCELNATDVEWRPGNVVGEGSFSTVYKGAYCGIDVAVKELKFKLSQDDKNYFRSEAALLQQLHHPRVVLLMGVCTTTARPFMVLEYLSGGTLHSFVHSTERDPLDHAAYFAVARDVAQGMNYLHRHEPQVLHLDLKSMNVLLDAYFRAKIADFGFSILRRSRSGSPAQRGSIRGTPAWMAPELLTKGDVSTKCDVYSYAIILWEMLSTSHPFKGLDIFQIMETIEAGGRPPLPSGGVSPELKELITSCWAQNPSLRPSFEEILGALDTAAIPGSWRGVLQKADVAPLFLSDVAATRTIIEVVEESVELVRRNHHHQQQQRPSTAHQVLYERLEPSIRHAADHKVSNCTPKALQERTAASPSRRSSPRRQAALKQASSKTSNSNSKRVISNKTSLREAEQRDLMDRRLASHRNDIDRVDGNRSVYSNTVNRYVPLSPNRERGHRRTESRNYRHDRKLSDKEERDRMERDPGRKYSRYRESHHEVGNRGQKGQSQSRRPPRLDSSPRERRSTSLEAHRRHRVVRRSSSRDHHPKSNERRFSSSDLHSDLRREVCRRNFHHVERESSGEEMQNQDSNEHLADSQDNLIRESYAESWASMDRRSSDIVQGNVGRSHLVNRRYSPSPRRRSPERRYSSPTRQSDYHRRRTSHSPQRRMQTPDVRRNESNSRLGPLVTSEQLMSQKQRLRPVRPAALSDLSHIPENSLNDISLILKTAMTKRRDAFDEELSGRDTFRSEDLEWSDWH